MTRTKLKLFIALIAAVCCLSTTSNCFAQAESPAAATESAGVLYEKGMSALKAKQPKVAIDAFQSLLKAHPTNALAPRALIELARTLGNVNRQPEALKLVEQGRNKYGQVPGFVDELDALKLHLTAGRGNKNNRKRAQKRIAELKAKIAAAEKQGDKKQVEALRGQMARLQRQMNGGMQMSPRRQAANEDVEKLRAEQERMIAEAHRLEDEGKVEEAYAMRRKADEIAAKIESMGRGGRGKKKGNDKGKNRKRMKQLNKRLEELRQKKESVTDEAEKAKLEKEIQKLESAKQRFAKPEKMKRAGKGNNADPAIRREYKAAKAAFDKARKAFKNARKSGDEAQIKAAKEELKTAREQFAAVREKSAKMEQQAQQQRINRLRENLKKRGLSDGAIERRIAFARKEQEFAQAYRKNLNELRKQWKKDGLSKDQVKQRQREEREKYQKAMQDRRRAMEQAEKSDAAPEKASEPMDGSSEEKMDGSSGDSMNGSDNNSMSSESGSNQAQMQTAKVVEQGQESGTRPASRPALVQRRAVEQSQSREMSKRLRKFAEKLRKQGIPQAQIEGRIRAQMQKFAKRGHAKQRGFKFGQRLEQQDRRIRRLEQEVQQLRKIIGELREQLKNGQRVAH